jgi:hypothetical protein
MFIKFLIGKLQDDLNNNRKKYESFLYEQWLNHKSLCLGKTIGLNSFNKEINYPKDLFNIFDSFNHINFNRGRSIISANYQSKKYILKFDYISTILLEYLIGYNVINKLADIIPTFIHTHSLSLIKGEPVFIDGYPSFHLCKPYDFKDINKKNYDETQALIILDHIDGNCLASQVTNLSLNDLSLIILNIFLSLKIGYEKFKFTHWDLHTENILLKRHHENSFLYKNNRYKIGSFLPIIFDYGLSAATVNNFRLETYERLGNGMNPKWVSRFTDVWKFMVSLTYDCWYHDKYDHYQFLKKFMIKFFIPSVKSQNFLKFIITSSDRYCFFTQNKFFNKSFNDLINCFIDHVRIRDSSFEWILKQDDIKINTIPSLPIYKNLNNYDLKQLETIIHNNDILKLFLLPLFKTDNDNEWYLLVKKFLKHDPLYLLDKLRANHIVVPNI